MPLTIPTMPDTPDPANVEPTPVGHGWLSGVLERVDGIIHTGWLLYAVAAVLLVLLATSIVFRRKRDKRSTEGSKQALTRTDRAITRFTGLLATAVVSTGAWKVFGLQALHLNPAFRVALFFFAEALVWSAWRRVRRHIHRHAELGSGTRTIYGIALGSATLAAVDASSPVEVLLRFFAAFVAGYSIVEELAEELDIYLTDNPHLRTEERKKPKRGMFGVKWSLTPERILVWLRLAEPTERSVEDVSRQARIARFARTAFRVHMLEETGAAKWRLRLAEWRLRRQTESGNEHLKLASDPVALGEVRAQLALLYGAKSGTSRSAVADLNPLRPAPRMAISSAPFAPDTTTGQDKATEPDTATGQPTDTEAVTAPDAVADTIAVRVPDPTPVNVPDAAAGPEPFMAVDTATGRLQVFGSGHSADMRPVSHGAVKTPAFRTPRRPVRRTPSPTSKWTKDQLKAFRLRDNRPDMTYPLIAREVGVSEKTVSRWFQKREAVETPDTAAVAAPAIPPTFDLPKKSVAHVNGSSLTPEENR